MKNKPVIVGVNGSPESVKAAIAAQAIALRMHAECIPVCAEPDYQALVVTSDGPALESVQLAEAAEQFDRDAVRQSLLGRVPDALADAVEIRHGGAAAVLCQAAQRHDAGLIVLGTRWHRGMDRLRGRLTRHVMGAGVCPVLVSDGSINIARILVALDLSWASEAAWEEARHWATTFNAKVRALHVMEPSPRLPFATAAARAAFARDCERADEELRRTGLWARIGEPWGEKVIRSGDAALTIVSEVRTWNADLLVLASHGKGWVDRMLIGSTTDELMQQPPVPTLVVPATRPPLTIETADVDSALHREPVEIYA